jgi:hypothetical protein
VAVIRGNLTLKIGEPGPMGSILVAGEPGSDIIGELKPIAGEAVIKKPARAPSTPPSSARGCGSSAWL